jgi:hypothetical protein
MIQIPSASQDRQCAQAKLCKASEYMVAPASKISDTVCVQAAPACKGFEFQLAGPPERDRICRAVRTCASYEYQTAAPTATTDRACQFVTICSAGQFTVDEATPNSNSVCGELTQCTLDEYETGAAIPGRRDRVCTSITVCDVPQFYESVPPTANTDRVCEETTRCAAHQYEHTAPSHNQNRCARSLFAIFTNLLRTDCLQLLLPETFTRCLCPQAVRNFYHLRDEYPIC